MSEVTNQMIRDVDQKDVHKATNKVTQKIINEIIYKDNLLVGRGK